jgi:hypothetical protein
LEDLLRRGRNRRDTDRTVIEQLGYRFSLWNGDFENEASVSVACGGWSEDLSGLYNLATVEPPPRAENLENAEDAAKLLLELSTPWDPEFARCGHRSVMYELDPPTARNPEVGWITFLKAGRQVPPDASAARVEVLSTGTLIVATERAGDCDVSTLVRLRDELDACGALESA